MKFYIASELKNYAKVQTLSKLLINLGWEHTYDWTHDWNHGRTACDSGNEINLKTLKSISQKEFDGVKNADIVIVLSPQGRGTHVELGMAAALNKIIYISHTDDKYFKCDENTSAFYWLPGIKHFVGDIEELVNELKNFTTI